MRRLVAILAALAAAGTANAAIVTYTSRTAFDAGASQNQSNIDFNALAPNGGFTFFGSNLTTGGVNFNNPGSRLFVISENFNNPFWDWNSGNVLQSNFGGDIIANLPAGFNSVGFEYLGGGVWPINFIVTLSTGDVFNLVAANQPGRNFIGFSNTSGTISSVRISAGSSPTIDNFVIANTPEPISLVVFGSLVVGGIVAVRRRMGKVAA